MDDGATTTTNGDGMVRFPPPLLPLNQSGRKGRKSHASPAGSREGGREREGAKEGRATDCLAMCVHSRGHPMQG